MILMEKLFVDSELNFDFYFNHFFSEPVKTRINMRNELLNVSKSIFAE